MDNYNIYVDLTSSNPLKNSQNRGNSERLSDRKITSPIKSAISRIKANFGKISQNSLNFTARVGLGTAQKIMIGGVA